MSYQLSRILEKPFPDSNAVNVAIVIVNYNGLEDIRRCIASLNQLDNQNFKTIIVDSSSPDGSGRKIKNEFIDSCECILLHENKGFAHGSNYGIASALSMKVEYVWLLNPDTEVQSNALDAFLQAADKYKESSAFGSKVYYGDGCTPENIQASGSNVIWCAGGAIDNTSQEIKMIGCHESDEGQYNNSYTCQYIPGCSMLVRAESFRDVGLLPEDYFMYFEETDWCCRLSKSGKELRYIPNSVVTHHTKDSKMNSAFVVYYYNRNELLFWFRESSSFGKAKLFIDVLLKRIPRNLRAFFLAKSRNDKEIFKAHLRSNIDFLFGRFGKTY